MDHVRNLNNHHSASAVLHLISSLKPIRESDMESLWSLFVRLPFFESKLESFGNRPENFADVSLELKRNDDVSHMGYLIHILVSLHVKTSCYFLSLYKEVDAKQITRTRKELKKI